MSRAQDVKRPEGVAACRRNLGSALATGLMRGALLG
jgi:hypothetical protein